MAFPQSSRFALFLRRAFSIKEQMADVNVLPDFFPTMEMGSDVMPDLRRSRGEHNLTAVVNQPAVAGQNSRVWFGNVPPGSIFVVRDLYVQLSGASNLDVGFAVTQPTGGFTIRFIRSDGREPGLTNSMVWGAGDTGPPAMGIIFGYSSPGNNFIFRGIDIVLPRTSVDGLSRSLVISADTVNTSLSVIAVGYERSLEPSETTF